MSAIDTRPFPLWWRFKGDSKFVVFARYSSEGMRRRAYDRLVKLEKYKRNEFIEPEPLKVVGQL